jgi:hypothetical protein
MSACRRCEHGVDHGADVACEPRAFLACLLHDGAVFRLCEEALSGALADLDGPRGLGLRTAEPDKLSEAARDLRVCWLLRHLADSTGGSRESLMPELLRAHALGMAEWRNGGMADIRQ